MSASPARACGVDFGTSNSTVGWLRPGVRPLLALEDGRPTLPSAVFFNADEDSTHFGREAMAQYLDGYEGRLVRSLKSLLGSSLIDAHTEVAGRALPFRALLTTFIGELKLRAEAAAGRSFDCAVFGRPVFFVDDDAEADRRAEDTLAEIARAVGFRELSFQYEPLGAAYHYEQTLAREEVVLIADIGGGTTDFSLVRLGPERARSEDRQADLLASGGVHIGGTDFDRVLNLACAMPHFGLGSRGRTGAPLPSSLYFQLATWHTIPLAYSRAAWNDCQQLYRLGGERSLLDRLSRLIERRAGHWLALQVEQAKIALSDTERTQLALTEYFPELDASIGRPDFTQASAELVGRVVTTLATLLQQAGLHHQQVDTLFFTGGGSGVPQLREAIAALLPAARACEGDRFGSIGAGLAVAAARRYG
ncbi:MAG: heat-shock protein [Candidatus Dactylopiibacterium carminicum]|uniref:Heat-shock protein n=1 Tax=Candidatus Dactylopiibacterium carminicum TaxID=857335 RepID=A0A272EPI4_9RHOO|nr:Hsp70 family protein [Candidatus Dactylopiibacterium carminicum]KAF7598339.1 Hsp70 family protein [Candidatus Dactylopiibacterium carminicum]PAS92042.1 MAG: heat-shock protein [Candidatus Dactylopiibacterium carminicum]PAS95470.1 MAG: heat-shock protein [Candidatus Dactylopiibacterium carminicum]PAS97390.1 MAG: heat-shock protein [Candidatus Dactylopiibacterium carminicum]